MKSNYDKDLKLGLIEEVGFRKFFKAERWEDFNRQFFEGLAPKYDFLNQILSMGQHRRIKSQAIRKAGIKNGFKVLDVCTGSGDIALEVARRYPGSRVIGIDFSENMLKIAKAKDPTCVNVKFERADAMHLTFEENSFDMVIISFGLRNLEDIRLGLLEMIRVTRPGGRIVNLDLGKPKGKFKQWLYQLYFLKIIPFLGQTIFHRGEFNSFSYLPESGKYFPSQEKLVELFEEIGLKEVKNHDYLFGSIAQQIGTVHKPMKGNL